MLNTARLFTYLIGVAGSFRPLPSGLVMVGGSLEGDTEDALVNRHELLVGRRDGEHLLTLVFSDISDISGEHFCVDFCSRRDLLLAGLCAT